MNEILNQDERMMIVSHITLSATLFYENLRSEQPPIAITFGAKLSKDGDKWCFLLGENLQDGVAGFGDTPALAADDFTKNWYGIGAVR